MKRIALALALLATPAMAQDSVPETVEVIGIRSLAGIWKIHFPGGIVVSVPQIVHATLEGQEAFCRMEDGKDALSVFCLPWKGSGTASLEDGRLHLAWGLAVFRFVVDAPIVSATAFMGAYKLKVFGDSHDASTLASGRKLAPSAGARDAAGQGATLRAALAAITSGAAPPPDDIARKKFGRIFGGAPPMSAASLQGLGALVQVIYLGLNSPPEISPGPTPPKRESPPQQPDPQFEVYEGYGVYDVEFANGQRLCGVHADEGGKVNVLCV
jgi:hypothetical protein